MRNESAWHLVVIWVSVAAFYLAFQFTVHHRLESGPLFYLIPICTLSYLVGREDGQREATGDKEKQRSTPRT